MVRTLHADLTTAQQSASSTPYIRVVFDSLDRATSRAYDNDDSPNRILQVQQSEGRYGSYTLVAGKPYAVSSVIRLQNNDEGLSSLDFKGYRVYIEWGFNTGSGIKTSRSGPEFVVSQELVSDKGISYLEIFTLSLWEKVNQVFVNVGNVLPLSWIRGGSSETKVSHILMQLLAGGELDAVILEDPQSTFSDQTTAAKTVGSTVTLLPATAEANDAAYFGKSTKFDRISLDLTQVLSSGSVVISWQYSKGAGVWSDLSVLTPSQGAATNSHLNITLSTGIQIQAFDVPSDWATDTVNSQGPYYYIRARVASVVTPGGAIEGDLIFGGLDTAFALDTTESTQGDAYLPTYTTTVRSPVGRVVKDILSYTLLGLRLREDGFHAAFVDNAQVSADNTYSLAGPHIFHVHNENQGVIIPNRVVVVSEDISSGAASFSGVSNDTASQDEIGIIPRIEMRLEVMSNAEAAALADDIIAQLKRDNLQGRVEVPLHAGQEVWDLVEVVDSRTGRTTEGRVSQLVRLYKSGQYIMQAIMGGAVYAVGIVPIVSESIEERLEVQRVRAGMPTQQVPPAEPVVVPVAVPRRAEPVTVPRPAPTRTLPERTPGPLLAPVFTPPPAPIPGPVPTPTPPPFIGPPEAPQTPVIIPRATPVPTPDDGLTPLARRILRLLRLR